MEAENLNSRRRVVLIYVATAVGTFLWLGAIIAAPYFQSRGTDGAAFLYACFAPICHQNPARSLHLWGFPLAVCSRCLGIYLGFGAGLVLYPFLRGFQTVRLPALRSFIIASVPIVVDFAGNVLRFWSTPDIPRALTGFLWGLILPFYFLSGLAELFQRKHLQV